LQEWDLIQDGDGMEQDGMAWETIRDGTVVFFWKGAHP